MKTENINSHFDIVSFWEILSLWPGSKDSFQSFVSTGERKEVHRNYKAIFFTYGACSDNRGLADFLKILLFITVFECFETAKQEFCQGEADFFPDLLNIG